MTGAVTARSVRFATVLGVGVIGGLAVHAFGYSHTAALLFLASLVVAGELLELRLERGTGITLAYAPVVVLAAAFPVGDALITLLAAQIVAFVVRDEPARITARLGRFAHRGVVAFGTVGMYQLGERLVDGEMDVATLFVVLCAAVAVQLVLDELWRTLTHEPTGLTPRGRLAWLALAASALLMAIGYRGVDGDGNFGIWAPVLFSIPLLATWYSFERLDTISRTHRQTIAALAVAPELAGMVRAGHAERVAELSLAIAADLELPTDERVHLETAALLHHLGQVTLEDPEELGRPNDPAEVAAVTAAMLREIESLAGAGEIIAGPSNDSGRDRDRLASQVLKVASAFDDLCEGDWECRDAAFAALCSAPGYLYDGRVVEALGRVVANRGLTTVR
ncbi:MAG TPA: hypothetical protein VFZ83_14525 [Acidimicrobiia bacterium]|nr:hypothetical protein [Acidimicrobiia bacterium]